MRWHAVSGYDGPLLRVHEAAALDNVITDADLQIHRQIEPQREPDLSMMTTVASNLPPATYERQTRTGYWADENESRQLWPSPA